MYQLIENSNMIFRIADGAAIPPDPRNMAYVEYLDWVAAGNTPLPAPQRVPSEEELNTTAVREYPKLKALRNMTPAQVQTWVDNNVNNLADAKDLLKTMAVAICILARRI